LQSASKAVALYVLAELEWYAGRRDGTTGIEDAAVYGTYQSDALVPPPLLAALQVRPDPHVQVD
jgi:hypothetical protein